MTPAEAPLWPLVVLLILLLVILTVVSDLERIRWERDRAVKELALIKRLAKMQDGERPLARLCGRGKT